MELADEAVAGLDEAVASGRYPSRSAALEDGLRRALHSVDLARAYGGAYATSPEDEAYGRVGLELLRDGLDDHGSR